MEQQLFINRPLLKLPTSLPLFGTKEFGVVDYGTNLLEVKPITGCNFNCIYCYVNESSKEKLWNAYVSLQHLISYVKKALKYKKAEKIHFHISSYGEPLFYDKIVQLVKKLKSFKRSGAVSIDTNASLLSSELIEELANAGLDRLNVKLDVFSKKKTKYVNGISYDIKALLKKLKLANKYFDIMITPLLLPGINDEDIIKIINWAKKNIRNKHWQRIALQKYEIFYYGKRPFPEQSMRAFYEIVKRLEYKTKEKLILSFPNDLHIVPDTSLPIKFKISEVVKAKSKLPGRWPNQTLLVAKDRIITLLSKIDLEKKVKAKIVFNENNIYFATLAK